MTKSPCFSRFFVALLIFSSFIFPVSSFASDDLRDQEISILRQKLDRSQKKLAQEQIKRVVYETQLQVVALRSFAVVAPVEYAELTRAILNKIIDDSIRQQYPGERLDLYVWFNALMGALPRGMDMATELKELMGEQAAGIYDPGTKKLYVSRNFEINTSLGQMILAHEITHAMQDQDYNLRGMGIEENENDDRAMAALAVAEGDATLLMSEYLLHYGRPWSMIREIPGMLMIDQSKFQKAPPAIQQTVLFPYLEGMNFFQALAGRTRQHPKSGGWVVGMDAAWRGEVFQSPPETTEQIMHPEKYLARELPARIEPFDTDSTASSQNVFGEFGIRTLLESSIDKPLARRAAAGWNGDRILLTVEGPGHGLKWATRWDTPKDAEEFAGAVAQALEKRVAGLKFERKGGDWSGQTDKAKVTIHLAGSAVEVQGSFSKM
ncbi:hypothetical protein LLG95_12715 [bacterium]|nr:hypothetical protein [bacterium]